MIALFKMFCVFGEGRQKGKTPRGLLLQATNLMCTEPKEKECTLVLQDYLVQGSCKQKLWISPWNAHQVNSSTVTGLYLQPLGSMCPNIAANFKKITIYYQGQFFILLSASDVWYGGGRYLYLSDDHVRNLNDWIFVWLREDSLPSGTLDVEAENSERSHVGPIILGRVRNKVFPRNVDLDLKIDDHFIF